MIRGKGAGAAQGGEKECESIWVPAGAETRPVRRRRPGRRVVLPVGPRFANFAPPRRRKAPA